MGRPKGQPRKSVARFPEAVANGTQQPKRKTGAASASKPSVASRTARLPAKSRVHQEIRKLQKVDNLVCIPRAVFTRAVRQVQQEICHRDMAPFRFARLALELLQCAVEECLTHLFADTQLAAQHARRITLRPIDMQLVRRLREPSAWPETR